MRKRLKPLEVPPELEHLIEKRDEDQERRGGKTRRASRPEDIAGKPAGKPERRQQAERRRKRRRKPNS
jgi:hypothetical protein